MMLKTMLALSAGLVAAGAGHALAQGAGTGPVGQQCQAEIAKFCAGKPHQGREVRVCLEGKKAEMSASCKSALDTTGPGRGQGQGQGKGPRAN